jgi:integrase
VRRILERAGLGTSGLGCAHRFRRRLATTYLAGLQKLMRHTQLSTTGRYLYLEPEDLAPRMAALEL